MPGPGVILLDIKQLWVGGEVAWGKGWQAWGPGGRWEAVITNCTRSKEGPAVHTD